MIDSRNLKSDLVNQALQRLFPDELIPSIRRYGLLRSFSNDEDCTKYIEGSLVYVLSGALIQKTELEKGASCAVEIHQKGVWLGFENIKANVILNSRFKTAHDTEVFIFSCRNQNAVTWFSHVEFIRKFNAYLLNQYERLQFLSVAKRVLAVEGQVVAYLASCVRYAEFHPDSKVVEIYGSQQCIGEAIGVSRTVVSTVLNRLARKGWIKHGYRTIEIQAEIDWSIFSGEVFSYRQTDCSVLAA